MPFSIIHKGVSREFDFYAPPGWQHWFSKTWTENQRFGLPLVVALHGGAQDQLDFQNDWFFPRVWTLGPGFTKPGSGFDSDPIFDIDSGIGPDIGIDPPTGFGPGTPVEPGAPRWLHNQFFVLYPYGSGWNTESMWSRAYWGVEPSGEPARRTLRAWNPGFTGFNDLIKDVSFIKAAINKMDDMLKAELMAEPTVLPSDFPWTLWTEGEPGMFDVDRRYLFGYSNGAMMAHRLVNKMTDYWAAVWTLAGSCGGKPRVGIGDNQYSIVNLPENGNFGVSLFAHHGDVDAVVPPGPYLAADFNIQSPSNPENPAYWMWDVAGFPDDTDYRPGYLPMNQALKGYSDYNNVSGVIPTVRQDQGIAGPDTALVASLPDGPNHAEFNPVVVGYRDLNLGHGGFADHANRYFDEFNVWQFFRTHPRVSL